MQEPHYVGKDLVISQRYLPHWQAGGSTYSICYDLLDRGVTVGGHLTPEERRLAKEALLFWNHQKWHVHVLTVMPDHVHVLARLLEASEGLWYSLSEILRGVKRHSAQEINRIRGRTGTLWQHEGFDRLIRSKREFDLEGRLHYQQRRAAGLGDGPL